MGSEPDAYKEVFMTGGAFNASRYNNKKLDDLWSKAAVETNKNKKRRNLQNYSKGTYGRYSCIPNLLF